MFGIATVKETGDFYQKRLPFSGVPVSFSTRQWEYPWTYQMFQKFSIKPGMRLLDVGCACNPFMTALGDLGFYITGLDEYSSDNPKNPYPQFGGFDRKLANKYLSFCEANMCSIPLPDNYFDCVYCISVLEHLDEQTRLQSIQEMIRVLKPGRPLIITEDYIPLPIQRPLPGIIEPCKRMMDYNFRKHIASAGIPLVDPSVNIPTDEEIALMRDRGELLLTCTVAPSEHYHFTSVGFVFQKP